MVGTAAAKAAPEASPEPSRPTYSSPSLQPVHGSSYYNEPVNIQGKSHRADVSLNLIEFFKLNSNGPLLF